MQRSNALRSSFGGLACAPLIATQGRTSVIIDAISKRFVVFMPSLLQASRRRLVVVCL
jgi:hypothetical protein